MTKHRTLTPYKQDWVDWPYLRFMRWQCVGSIAALKRANRLFARVQYWHNGNPFRSPMVQAFSNSHAAIVFAANVSKMLWPNSFRNDTEKIRGEARAKHLVLVVGATRKAFPVLSSQGFRNDVEHFDNRMDTWVAKSTHHAALLLYVGDEAAWLGTDRRDKFIRFDKKTRMLWMHSRSVSLVDLEKEIRQIYALILRAIRRISRRVMRSMPL